MPDWFYRTVSQPLLFRLPAEAARNVALGVMGTLCRLPFGTAAIDLLGHLGPDPRLKTTCGRVAFPASVGLGSEIDPKGFALRAFEQFGVGFIEIGPVFAETPTVSRPVTRWPEQQGWWTPDPPQSLSLEAWRQRLDRIARCTVPLVARLGCLPESTSARATDEGLRIVAELGSQVSVLALDTLKRASVQRWTLVEWRQHLDRIREACSATSLWLCVPADVDPQEWESWLAEAIGAGIDGVMVDGLLRHDGGELHGTPGRDVAIAMVRWLRERWPHWTIIASGGIHSPADARAFLDAGADLLKVDTGLVSSGPGLVKRINDAMLCGAPDKPAEWSGRHAPDAPLSEKSWFWSALMGAGMFVGAIAALVIASTRVVLPYDEVFSGLTRDELLAANPKLLAFLTHDRVTLGGTMLAVSVQQLFLAVWGLRHGRIWAARAVLIPSTIGFATFFLFLGFGYFDPFHAFVTAVLLQFLLLAWHTRLPPPRAEQPPTLVEDWRFRLNNWGQFLVIVQGAAVLAAGLTISFIGCTSVFVPEDLEFMQTTVEAIRSLGPRLIPLIAHDRATFGGMLVCSGICTVLTGLWGFREGNRWVWWMLFLAGSAGYIATLLVHLAVGYTSGEHLLPAFAGLAELWIGLALSFAFLNRRGQTVTPA